MRSQRKKKTRTRWEPRIATRRRSGQSSRGKRRARLSKMQPRRHRIRHCAACERRARRKTRQQRSLRGPKSALRVKRKGENQQGTDPNKRAPFTSAVLGEFPFSQVIVEANVGGINHRFSSAASSYQSDLPLPPPPTHPGPSLEEQLWAMTSLCGPLTTATTSRLRLTP